MLRSQRHLTVCLLGILTVPSFLGADAPKKDLKARIEEVINGKDYKQAHWGLLVVDAKTGKTVYEHNPDKLFFPASTTKLYSSAAALDALGADFKFLTPVYSRGEIVGRRLKGDLILVASGDLTLGGRTTKEGHMAYKDHDHTYANAMLGRAELTDTDPLAGLNDLAKQVKESGIHQVDGEVLIDDRMFEKNRATGSGPELLTPIMVNDNVIDAVVTPGAKAGDRAKVRMRPATRFIQMDADVVTVPAGKKAQLAVAAVGFQRFVVRGQIPVGDKPRVRIYPVDEPAGFARALFIEALRRQGVKVRASYLQPPRAELPARNGYGKLKRVALYTSPPFAEAVKVTLKVSHNLYASVFPLLVAVRQGKSTLRDGLVLQRKFLAGLGVDVDSISFAGGAGGSPADCVTPRATVQLLRALARRSDYKWLQEGLPVMGVDGTLSKAVPEDSPIKGKVRAKTGTYYWHDVMNDRYLLTSKALAGTMTMAGGRPLIVAIFVNKVPLPKDVTPLREGKVIGRLCEIIYQDTPKNEK
jgi:D-alanyl-D-alanine carboxypeptidase/D-alanyl-D-alanine-endopeptidase (penicillin-binding protein 4)